MGKLNANPSLIKTNKISIKKQNLGGGKLIVSGPIIEDILQSQTSTIGSLHYNLVRRDGGENKQITTIFGNSSGGPNGSTSDKVVRNQIQNSWNIVTGKHNEHQQHQHHAAFVHSRSDCFHSVDSGQPQQDHGF